MKTFIKPGKLVLLLFLVGSSLGILAASACDSDDDATETEKPTLTIQLTEDVSTAAVEPTATVEVADGEVALQAASASITVDGDITDWDRIEGAAVSLEQIEIPDGADWDEPNPLPPLDASLKVAADTENIYVLLEIPDDYDFNPDDHNLSASLAVQFLIEETAGPHMGASDDDLEAGLGMVDIWHWELDCGPGEISGGGGIAGGDDPACNLDDEYATDPEEREDDGEGDAPNPDGENGLIGVWEHTARAEGAGAAGTWIFEMSRPLQSGDAQDAQFVSGGTALIAIAYFDADESSEGWTDTGHLQSADLGWIVVTLP